MRRVSLQGNKFTGLDHQPDGTVADVIIVNAAGVSRSYYKDSYDPNARRLPTCWSKDTQRPAPEVPDNQKQSARCMDCTHNIRGSGEGGGRACRFGQRLAIVEERALKTVYQLQVPASSIFGKAAGKSSMPLQAYAKFLSGHGTPSAAVVTRISFDAASVVPKLFFYPQRPLEEQELILVREMVDSDETLEAIAFDVTPHNREGSPFTATEGFTIAN